MVLAQQVAVTEQRERTANATDDREHVGGTGAGDARHDEPAQDEERIVEGERRANHDAEKHDDDERFHDPREPRTAPEENHGKGHGGVRQCTPRARDRAAGEILDGKSATAHQRAAHRDRPEHEVNGKTNQNPARQMSRPAFEGRQSRGKLPACKAFAEDKLEERAEGQRPQQREPTPCASRPSPPRCRSRRCRSPP